MITFRRASSEDADLFREIRLKALKIDPDAFGSTYESALERTMESWQEQLDSTVTGDLRNKQFAFDGAKTIGVAALYREAGVAYGDIIMMWVDEKYRGSTVATLLVSSLINWAKEVGFESVYLNVTRSNERAIRFYKKCGFEQAGEELDATSCRGLNAVRMKIVLGD